jgi:di/tricarboxylate transporter
MQPQDTRVKGMSPALLSLAALLLAILLSCFTQKNIGLLAVALAWVVGLLSGVDSKAILSGFPVTLFMTLAGITLLFTQAEINGTLSALTRSLLWFGHGNGAWVVILLTLLAALLSTIGAGAIAATALVTPIAMRTAQRSGLPLFLMAVLIGLGANAGNLSPVSPVGVVTNGILSKFNVAVSGWSIFGWNFLAHALLLVLVFVSFGGLALFRKQLRVVADEGRSWTAEQRWTLVVIGALLAGVVLLDLPLGLAAFAGAALLVLLRAAPDNKAIAAMPWGVILMVSGVTLLIALIERTGGMDLFSRWIVHASSRDSVHAVVAFVTGVISTYSSTSGVVLPAFLPTAPRLAADTGAGVQGIVSSIVLGSHLVDVSPLSTIGAMAVAAVEDEKVRSRLFHQLILWSIAMCLVGPALSFLIYRNL